MILDIICFEYIILSFSKLVEWTGTKKKDKIAIREEILSAVAGHKIDISRIEDSKTGVSYGIQKIFDRKSNQGNHI